MAKQKVEVEFEVPAGWEWTGERPVRKATVCEDDKPSGRAGSIAFWIPLRRVEPIAIQACRKILVAECTVVGDRCPHAQSAQAFAKQAIKEYEAQQ